MFSRSKQEPKATSLSHRRFIGSMQAIAVLIHLIGTPDIVRAQELHETDVLYATSPKRNGNYGDAVALTDQYLVIGDGTNQSGTVDVFDLQTRERIHTFRRGGERFGTDVAIHGSKAIIGTADFERQGSAYIYDLESGSRLFRLRPSNSSAGDLFGSEVAINDSVVLVGAAFSESAFLFDVQTGQELMQLVPSDPSCGFSGGVASVALSDKVAFLRADCGIGRVLAFDVKTGDQLYELTASDGYEGDSFGDWIQTDGKRLVASAPRYGENQGVVYVFDLESRSEIQRIDLDNLGGAVAIDGDHVILNTPYEDLSANGERQSHTVVQLVDIETGNVLSEFIPPNENEETEFTIDGYYSPVAIQDGTVVVGVRDATIDGIEVGAAFVLSTRNSIVGDLDHDGVLDVDDVDLLTKQIRLGGTDSRFDVNDDASVDSLDLSHWVREVAKTYFGDSNLDGEFNSRDLVDVFVAGEYEDGIDSNSGWSNGDWNGDAEFSTADLVTAFEDGGYDRGPRTDVNTVPEPSSVFSLLGGLVVAIGVCRRGCRS